MEILEKIQTFLIVVFLLLMLWVFLLYAYHAIRRIYQAWRLNARMIAFHKLNHIVITTNADLDYWLAHADKNDWLDIKDLTLDTPIDAEKYGAVWLTGCRFLAITQGTNSTVFHRSKYEK